MEHREVIEHRFFLVFNHTVQFQCVVSEFEENGEARKENELLRHQRARTMGFLVSSIPN